MSTIYVVGKVGFQYNDEIYFRGEVVGVTPQVAFRSKEKAEEVALEKNIQTLKEISGDDWYNGLNAYCYDYEEIFSDARELYQLLNSKGIDEDDIPWNQFIESLTEDEFKQFYDNLELRFYEVHEVVYED